MEIQKQQLEQFDRKADKILNLLSKGSFILVGIVVAAITLIVMASMFFEPVESDVAAWCDEYHPTWTYEQCKRMVGR